MPSNAACLQRRLLRLALDARGPLIVSTAAAALGACVVVAQMLVASRIIAGVFPAHDGTVPVTRLLAWLLALLVLRALVTAASELSAQRIATSIKSSLRSALVVRLVARGPRRSARERTGEVVTTAMDGVEKLDAYYRRFVPQAIATTLVPLVVLGAVAWLDPASGLILAMTGPLIPLFMWLLGTLAEQRTREQWATLERLGGRFLDILQGLPTLTVFGRDREAASSLAAASEGFRVRTMSVLRIAFLSGFVLELAASVSTALVAVGIGVRLIEGWIPFGTGLAVLLLAPEFYLPFRQLGQRHHAGMEGIAAAERIFELLDAPAESDLGVPVDRRGRRGRSNAGPEQIVFERVGFAYPGSATPALRDINLTLPAGTMTAVVGPSGAGKSTLAALVLRFLEPGAGRLLSGGRPIAATAAVDWRRHVALVSQRPRFFDGSLLDNLRIGDPYASRDAVIAAATMADAHGFIEALPQGYDTPLGEAAARLSVGERQRLAVARALLKPGWLLVLDEPTASLDARTEAAVARAIAGLRHRRTILVIAHRHETIRRADRIVVLDAGRIVDACPGLPRLDGRSPAPSGHAAWEVA